MNKVLAVSFWSFLVSLPFGYRRLLYQFTAGFDEYEAVFAYAGDVFLLFFLISSLIYFVENSSLRPSFFVLVPLVAFVFFSVFSAAFAGYKVLAFYNFFRLALAVAAALAVVQALKGGSISLQKILTVIAALAVFQSAVGFGQFINQGDLGLEFLGEPEIGPLVGGAAKIPVSGGKLLRAYGTFPHPNVLAAFLALGFFGFCYLWIKRPADSFFWNGWRYLVKEILLGAGIFAVSLGLLLTFSRAGWGVSAVFAFLLIVFGLRRSEYRRQTVRLLILLLFVFSFLLAMLGWAVFPRAQVSLGEPAAAYRFSYNVLAVEIIENNPFGVGLGNQVIYAVKNEIYQRAGMDERWQWQPIHNIYLLMGAETGVLGLLSFLAFAAALLIPGFRRLFSGRFWDRKASGAPENRESDFENFVPKIMLAALLVFGLFDHFLWTLQPGRLMLWLIIGIMMSICPCSTTDSARASGARDRGSIPRRDA